MQAYRLLLTQAADLIRSHTGRFAPAVGFWPSGRLLNPCGRAPPVCGRRLDHLHDWVNPFDSVRDLRL